MSLSGWALPTRKLQEFLSDSPWDDEGCMEELRRFVGERLGDQDGVLIVDDTGFAKKGTSSAGVGRQYSGTLGRVDNCQIGVFLGYASQSGHTLVDRRLYLTEPWFTDPSRQRSKAALPPDLTFQTKHQLALAMLQGAHDAGHLPYQWVTGDAAYGGLSRSPPGGHRAWQVVLLRGEFEYPGLAI